MIFFPNCKINLGLYILEKRNDGFHDLETIFYPLPFKDALETVQAPDFKFTNSGLVIDGAIEDNICVKAYSVLKKDFPELPAVHMHLHKCIPTGAGLGGGSADGAYTLMLLNKQFNLGIREEALMKYALMLGSDSPFFIKNKPCIGTGRGEILEPVTIDLSLYKIILVNPGIHVNTGWAFSKIQPQKGRRPLKEIIQQPLSQWEELLSNDFENPVFDRFPEIQTIKQNLYSAGALYSSMSGSGSTVFGIYKKSQELVPEFPAHYFVRSLDLV